MNVELTLDDLLTVAGNAAFVWLVIQFLIKTWLKQVIEPKWYPAAMNGIAALLGIVGAVLAQSVMGIDFGSALNAVLVGLGGAFVAVGANEAVGNLKRAV